MKSKPSQLRNLFHIGIVIVLMLGLHVFAFGSHAVLAEDSNEGESNENVKGFEVVADKVEGDMDPLKTIMTGVVEIEEGIIYGLTLMKVIEANEHGTLVIKIKAEKPVPVTKLTGTTTSLTLLGSCTTENPNWVCIENVQMLLTQQSVESIELNGAKVEACYLGQCSDDNQESVETTALKNEKSIDDIDKGINSLNAIMDVVDEKLEQAVETEQTIINEKQAEKVDEALNKFDSNHSDQDQLVDNANDIRENYSKLNETVSEFALTSSVVNDILKQSTQTLEQFDEEIAKMEESLTEDSNKNGKKKKQTLETLAAQEELAEKISNVKEKMSEVQKKIAKYEEQLEPLEKSSATLLDNVTQFYNKIQEESKNLEKFELNEHVEQIRELLDVAEPSKELEKRLNDVLDQVDDTNLVEQTEQQEEIIEEANQQAKSSVLSIALAQEIGESEEEIEEHLEDKLTEWEDHAQQVEQLEKELQEVVSLAKLPETLFMEHKLTVEIEEQHDYRSDMLENINHWQKLLSTIKEKQEEIETAKEQHETNQASLDELADVILKSKDRYTSAELATIAKYIPIGSHLEKERKISELIESGSQIIETLDPIIETSQQHLHQLKANSAKLVNKKMMVNFLDEEMFEQYEKEFASFKQSVSQLKRPIKQLNNHLVIAEELLGNDASKHKEFQSIYETITTVTDMMNDLDHVINELDSLPYFSKVKELVNEMESLKSEMEEMLQ